MKWRSSLSSDIGSNCSDSRYVFNESCTNISTCHVDQALVPQELSAHLRIEALVEEAEGIASLHKKVGSFIASPSRGGISRFIKSRTPDVVSIMEPASVLHPSSYQGVSGSVISVNANIPDRVPVMESASVLYPSSYQGVSCSISSVIVSCIPDWVPAMESASVLYLSSY